MNHIFTHLYKIGGVLFLLATSCSTDFLEVKSQKSHVIVETLDDVEALLNNQSIMNRTDYYRMISDGDMFFTDSKITSSTDEQKNLYLWQEKIDVTGRLNSPWDLPYQQIFYANIALETLEEIGVKQDKQKWEELYGYALFYRAWAHYNLLQDFAEGFEPDAAFQLGVPIITDSQFPKEIHRASLEQVYSFILESLTDAEKLLPQKADIKTRPSLQAVYALQARVYQNLNKFEKALACVNKALEIDETLLDYNSLSFAGAFPFSDYNLNTHPEILFFTSSRSSFTAVKGVQVVKELVDSYSLDDLRRKAYMNEEGLFIGNYSGTSSYHFTGLAIDELYLIKAECLVRTGETQKGLDVLQKLLINRFRKGKEVMYKSVTNEQALFIVLDERRKQLIGRGTRWTDLKRLNREVVTSQTLIRTYNNQDYTLPPNDPRYVFEIPFSEIEMSGLEQNIRTK